MSRPEAEHLTNEAKGRHDPDPGGLGDKTVRQGVAAEDFDFRSAMRKVTSPVFVITTRRGDQVTGLASTNLCPISTDPPLVVFSVNRGTLAERLIGDSDSFAISYLTEDQHRIARLFASPELPAEEQFSDGRWESLITGSPVLEGAAVALDCVVESRVCHGTHVVVFGRVVAARSLDQDCLLYRDGSFRRLAPVV